MNAKHCRATLSEVLAEAERGRSGRILNLQDFPAVSSDKFFPRGLASDVHALFQVLRNWLDAYPFPVMRWGLCASADALHKCRIDTAGFATACSILSGERYWLLALPKDMDFSHFGSTLTFSKCCTPWMNQDEETRNNGVQDDDKWRIVALKLIPGNTL